MSGIISKWKNLESLKIILKRHWTLWENDIKINIGLYGQSILHQLLPMLEQSGNSITRIILDVKYETKLYLLRAVTENCPNLVNLQIIKEISNQDELEKYIYRHGMLTKFKNLEECQIYATLNCDGKILDTFSKTLEDNFQDYTNVKIVIYEEPTESFCSVFVKPPWPGRVGIMRKYQCNRHLYSILH